MSFKNHIYKIGKQVRALDLFKYMSRTHPRILMYHRVDSEAGGDGIHVDAFRAQMVMLKKQFNVVPVHKLLEDDSPTNAVALTFDDGYADFYHNGFPILQELGLPCSLYVTTGFVNRKVWMWPDHIRYLLANFAVRKVNIPELEIVVEPNMDRAVVWSKIANYCLTLTDSEKKDFIGSLSERFSIDLPVSAPSGYEAVSWDNLREMKKLGLDVGSHTVSHPILTNVTPPQLSYEVIESKREIEVQLGGRVDSFCYPNGTPSDISEEVKAVVQSAGYKYALAAYPTVAPLENRWEIKRYPVSDDLVEFDKVMFGLRYLSMRSKSYV